jgi:uncharacterized damage-inducible protein DinB
LFVITHHPYLALRPKTYLLPIQLNSMQFKLADAIEILQRTPGSFHALLNGLSDEWTTATEVDNSWSPKDVLTHLVYLDRANWLHRAKLLLATGVMVRFDPLDRTGGKKLYDGLTLPELLNAFQQTRREVLSEILELDINEQQYGQTALHPDFGEVKLSQLLSAWMVHDLTHLSQVSRILVKQYRQEVGPWISFLRILN